MATKRLAAKRATRIPLGEPVEVYKYTNEDGHTLFETCRYEPKAFRQRRTVRGKYLYNLDGIRRVLFRLPYVLMAVKRGDKVYITEGEKDSINARKKFHICTTTNPGGKGMGWRDEYSETLRGADVVVIADNDDPAEHNGENPGVVHALKIARALEGVVASAKVVAPPTIGHDISDHIDAGLTLDDLIPVVIPDELVDVDQTDEPNLTDLGNARRLVATHGNDLRYCIARKTWYVWNGQRWEPDETGQVFQRAKATVRQMHNEADNEPDDDKRIKLIAHALASESAPKIKAMVELAQTEPGIPVRVDDLDANPWILNTENGTLILETLILREHRREDLCTRITACPYEPGAKDSVFERFLDDVLPDAVVRSYIQKAAGISLTGDDAEGHLYLVQGPTNTGKTTFLEAVKAALGSYAMAMDIRTLGRDNKHDSGGRPRSDLVRLFGVRFVTSTEAPENIQLDEARVKQLTGGDTVTARTLYAVEQEARPSWTIWIGSNFRPRVNNADDAIWNRLRELPFTLQHTGKAQDKKIRPHFLRSKAAQKAILAWLVDGLRAYHAEGLEPPDAIVEVTEEYRRQMNPVMPWVDECCVLESGAWTPTHRLRRSYERFAGNHALGVKRFTQALRMVPDIVEKPHTRTNERGFRGIRLASRDGDDDN